jgi:hypothetical protein
MGCTGFPTDCTGFFFQNFHWFHHSNEKKPSAFENALLPADGYSSGIHISPPNRLLDQNEFVRQVRQDRSYSETPICKLFEAPHTECTADCTTCIKVVETGAGYLEQD